MDRHLDAGVSAALDQVRRELAPATSLVGPVQEVYLPAAGTAVPVAHEIGAIPDGYQIWLAYGGNVRAAQVEDWTDTLAFLVADANHTRARVSFVTITEGVQRG
jgi:hypothetical protein